MIDRNGLKLTQVYESSEQNTGRSILFDESIQALNPLNILIFPAIGIAILGLVIWKRKSKKIDK